MAAEECPRFQWKGVEKMKRSILTVSLALLMFAGVGAADDFLGDGGVPNRGDPLSVYGSWEFLSDPGQRLAPESWTYILPDGPGVNGPFDSVGGSHGEILYPGFATHADAGSSSEWSWQLTDAGGSDDGVLIATPTGGKNDSEITFNLQNWVDDMEFKLIVVQMTYWGSTPPHVKAIQGQELAGTAGEYDVFGGRLLPPIPFDPNHIYESWGMEPNPDWEQVVISVPAGTQLDEVVIDTVSVPEPATVTLLVLGAVVILQRRRR